MKTHELKNLALALQLLLSKAIHAITHDEHGQHKPKNRFGLILVGPDERIKMPLVTLTKPIKPGFRRPISLVPDEEVDVRPDGSFATAEVVEGDSTVSIRPSSTSKQIDAYINGDGSTGNKTIRITSDGHIGDGDVSISQDIAFVVAHPDATAFGPVVEGTDEPIPGVTPPSP
jgi:hypothetical protein